MSVALKQTARSPRVLRTHLLAYACRIYVTVFRASIGLCMYWRLLTPLRRLYPLPVRRASLLPTASSRFHLAMDTLAVQLTLPPAGCRGLSPPSERALPGHQKESADVWALFNNSKLGGVPRCFGLIKNFLQLNSPFSRGHRPNDHVAGTVPDDRRANGSKDGDPPLRDVGITRKYEYVN